MESIRTDAPQPSRRISLLAALLLSAMLVLGCSEEKLPANPPSETGTVTISVGAV
jgi:hypothetical protein